MSELPVRAVRMRPMGAFWPRLLVSAIGLPAVIGLGWLGGWWFAALALVAGCVAMHEFTLVTRTLHPVAIAAYAGLLVVLLGIQVSGLLWGVSGAGLALALGFLVKGLGDTRGSATASVATTVLGVAWIGSGLGFMLLLRDIPQHGRLAALTVLIAVFAGDSAAYVFGILTGRHKLAPRLSPAKTWEGFAAGFVTTVLVTWIALYKTGFLPGGRSLALGLAVAVAAPAGDLFESSVKRDMQVKDSGRILPGHGGMLDRVDALLFASVAAFYVILAFGET
jgi:phosphatidate cytidylyltransferase